MPVYFNNNVFGFLQYFSHMQSADLNSQLKCLQDKISKESASCQGFENSKIISKLIWVYYIANPWPLADFLSSYIENTLAIAGTNIILYISERIQG